MLDLTLRDRLGSEAQPEPELERLLEVRLVDRDGRLRTLPNDGRRAGGFRASAIWHARPRASGIVRAWDVELSIVSHEAQDRLGVQVALPLDAPGTRFLIPGVIYGENRSQNCRVRYPRVAPGSSDALTADAWAFRVDRSTHGVVFGWTDRSCLALATTEGSTLGLSGLGFTGGEASALILNFPAREEPVTFVGQDSPAPAEVMTHSWQAGEIATLRFQVFVLPPEPHAYDAVLRRLYQQQRETNALNPWTSVDDAAALAAHGLHRWHYREEHGILAETTAFHREADEAASVTGDRDVMHVAWLSGAPSAFALLRYARKQQITHYRDAAIAVLDTISAGLAPCGAFWGHWTPNGWNGGWNGHPDWIHSRTIAEATLFTARAISLEHDNGVDHQQWADAVESNLRFALQAQRDDGAFPALIDGRTGDAKSWDGAAGLLWIPALLESSGPFAEGSTFPSPLVGEGQGGGFLESASLAGAYYARFIEDEFIFGAPEDIHLAPSSEDGYNAVIAYVALYEATREKRWLDLACRAAEWMLSFRFAYNLAFPAHTMLDSYDYRSRGADLASPRNQHLHTYGLICLPELVRLSEHSGDNYFRDRAADSLACALQFIAREDGDFNARKGMVTERYYNTRCFGPKGSILPVSHAWCAGLVLYACQAGLALDLS